MTAPRVLVAGVGNLFLGDDGFGVEVVRRLRERRTLPGVRVADFGMRGLDLTYSLLEGYELVVLVDASSRGEAPGTVYLLEPSVQPESPPLDAHGMAPRHALRAARAMGARLHRVVVVACEPESFGPPDVGRVGLSMSVSRAVDPAVRIIEDLVRPYVEVPAST